MTDIRIQTTFLRNNKTRRLKQKLGADGVLALIGLWIYAAENRPKGILTGLDDDDIAMDAGWDGDTQAFIEALTDEKSKFLDWNAEFNCWEIHNWRDRNPFVFHYDERSDHARKAAEARWNKKTKNAPSIQNECSEHARSMPGALKNDAQTQKIDAPIPTPIPTPIPIPKDKGLCSEPRKQGSKPADDERLFEDVENKKPNDPVIMIFPKKKKGEVYELTQSRLDRFQELYPMIDVLVDFRKALSWTESNPTTRKQNVETFLNRWLSNDRTIHPQRGGNGQTNSPEDKQQARIKYHRTIADEERKKGASNEEIQRLLSRCGLKENEISLVMGTALAGKPSI